MADGVLHQAVQGVTDLIKRPGLVNVDFADVKTIMSNAGTAIMGIGEGYGEKRAATAAYNAINSPLMDCKMSGAKGILFNITGGASVGIHEINEAISIITEAADEDAFIIWGHVFDPEMEDAIQITVIATGFDDRDEKPAPAPQPQARTAFSAQAARAAAASRLDWRDDAGARHRGGEEPQQLHGFKDVRAAAAQNAGNGKAAGASA